MGSIYLDRDAADLLELRLRAAVLAGAERVAVVDFLDAAGKFVSARTKRRPMIVPVVLEA